MKRKTNNAKAEQIGRPKADEAVPPNRPAVRGQMQPRKGELVAQTLIDEARDELGHAVTVHPSQRDLTRLEYKSDQIPPQFRDWFPDLLERAVHLVCTTKNLTRFWKSFVKEIAARGVAPTLFTVIDLAEDGSSKDWRRDAFHYFICRQFLGDSEDCFPFIQDTLYTTDHDVFKEFPFWYGKWSGECERFPSQPFESFVTDGCRTFCSHEFRRFLAAKYTVPDYVPHSLQSTLFEFLDDRNPLVRYQMALNVTQWLPHVVNDKVVQNLVESLASPIQWIPSSAEHYRSGAEGRHFAVTALGNSGSKASAAFSQLKELAGDSNRDSDLKQRAVDAIANMSASAIDPQA